MKAGPLWNTAISGISKAVTNDLNIGIVVPTEIRYPIANLLANSSKRAPLGGTIDPTMLRNA